MMYAQVYFYIVTGVFFQEKLFNAQGGFSWEDANKSCAGYGLEYKEANLINSTIKDDEEFWIGKARYQLTTPWIELLGCYIVHTSDTETASTCESVVLCQHNCGSATHFGYKPTTGDCICFPTNYQLGTRIGMHSCTQENIGSVYLIYKEFPSLATGETYKCATIKCQSGNSNIQVTSCNEKANNLAGICEYNNVSKTWNHKYEDCRKICITHDQLLLPSTFCAKYPDLGIRAWSNVLRIETEQVLFGDNGNTKLLKCFSGTLTTNNQSLRILSTRERNCKTKIERFICEKSYNSSINTTFQHEQSVFSISQGDYFFTTSTESTELANRENQKRTPSNTGAIIGSIIGLMVLATSVIILFLLCRKRSFRKGEKGGQKTDSTSVSYKDVNIFNPRSNISPEVNLSYGMVNQIPDANNIEISDDIQMNSNPIETEQTYMDTSYGEYDRLNDMTKRKIRQNAPDNMYDSNEGVKNSVDPTYDSTINTKRLNESNDVYDHSRYAKADNDYEYSTSVVTEKDDVKGVYDRAF